ncbi:hypothetical protein HGG74_10420 [Arthrobacter sp. E918]|uniref:Cell division protein FtsL n=2 Tax=Arthrobacter mobilis TaxID=2724944 RepID=A0A7X6HD67_9MICC|nr:hypothetical protein [Arthrobacter mobilis]
MNARGGRQPAVVGSSAPALAGPRQRGSVAPESSPRRTPLSLVATAPARRRVPFALFCFAVLVAALGCVLMLNISVSGAQYEIVELRGRQVSLEQQNEKLTQQLENNRAPQNLAAEAAKLGMVASPSVGSIDLETMKVVGQPEAAAAGTSPDGLVARPEVPGQAPARTDQDRAAAAAKEKAAKEKAAKAKQAKEAAEAARARQQQGAPSSSARTGSERKFTEAELNGGTIPAPQQRGGQ